MQPLPPQLELPEGDRFALPTVSAVRELVPPGGQLPAHMVLMMICGKELWVPLDREIARQMANILAPSVNNSGRVETSASEGEPDSHQERPYVADVQIRRWNERGDCPAWSRKQTFFDGTDGYKPWRWLYPE